MRIINRDPENVFIVPKELGKKIFEWEALDYFPYTRKRIWFVFFPLIFLGIPVLFFWLGNYGKSDTIMLLTFITVFCVYLWVHRNGEKPHHVEVFEHGVRIDGGIIPLKTLEGFWMVYEENMVGVLNLERKSKWNQLKISLQMGEKSPDFFRKNWKKVGLPELTEKKESVLDIWIRVWKL